MTKRGALWFAPLFLLWGVVAFAPQLMSVAKTEPSHEADLKLPPITLIRVHKAARIMELYSEEVLVHTIRRIQLGDAPVGHKRFEGDERTPEGRYVIDWRNPHSAYHLSLHISYPNEADRAYAAERGRSAGGLIMIHGQPNAWNKGRVSGDWTDGCIAVSNSEIEALWDSVADGTLIEIAP